MYSMYFQIIDLRPTAKFPHAFFKTLRMILNITEQAVMTTSMSFKDRPIG